MDRELIDRNPFGKMEGLTVGASDGRDYFVSREEAAKVMECLPRPAVEATVRFKPLRGPSLPV